jgi:hypothetical protein
MPKINDVFKRKAGDGPAQIRLVGVHGAVWVAASLDEFAPPFEIAPVELSRDYGAEFAEVAAVDEVAAWHALDDDWLDQARLEISRVAVEPLPSPEDQFRAQDKEK